MNLRRLWLAAGAAWPAIAWTGALCAQTNAPVVIGWLSADERNGPKFLNEGMAALGWKLGTQYVLEARFFEGRMDRLPALAQELAEKRPAVIVVTASVAARAAAAAAPTTQRWPVVGQSLGIPRRGGLFSFGPDSMALIRRSASYVDRILKGAKPGDLPIEQPATFELVLNLKTAKQLGITIPSSLRLRATEVIE